MAIKTINIMKELIKKLRANRQELVVVLNSGLKFGRCNHAKGESEILEEMDMILDEMDNLLTD